MQEVKEIEPETTMEETAEVTQEVQAEEPNTGNIKADELARKVDEINEQKTTR